MADSSPKGGWRRALRYTFGGALCLLAVVAAQTGLQWYWSVVVLCGAFLIILGRRRIFRPGVTRTTDLVVCRYIPWYEGNAYYLNVALPLTGAAMAAAGYAPGNPVWLRFGGIFLIAVTPLMTYSAVRMWRRCILCFSPSALTVRTAAPGDALTEIPRERVQSITPKVIANSANGVASLQVEIAYQTADSSDDATKTVLLGLQLTVVPDNLLNALVAWKDATNDDPSELLDRIERILMGRSMAGV
ncbi:hypothetical protein [Mycobacterium sp. AZCC_0083]|uniref:hypothetical protein n=1 Tax=Mycobacterium sp. AZCC_0083 TaxID=2735882 RepID=UPI00161F497B|nr:hypothetical protein [Mycobacterium sp. AZCC_0083]